MEAESKFRQLLETVILNNGVGGIAEEMSEQGLAEAGVSASVPQLVARNLGVRHIFCDPDRRKRAELGIEQENDIRISAFMQGKTEEYVERALKEQFRKRETAWLAHIRELGVWPVLLVCGANHVSTFSEFLSELGLSFKVLHADWQA